LSNTNFGSGILRAQESGLMLLRNAENTEPENLERTPAPASLTQFWDRDRVAINTR
jgi:hypothetical protein